jgi:hypothetical protein
MHSFASWSWSSSNLLSELKKRKKLESTSMALHAASASFRTFADVIPYFRLVSANPLDA